jgi:methylthioribulose-1-phosphate dehydratase
MGTTNPIEIYDAIAEIGRDFHARGWSLGTSGNFSAVTSREPFRMALTVSGVDKGKLTADQILVIDESQNVIEGTGRPSAEARLHVTIARLSGTGAILHTHSVWSNIVSEAWGDRGGLTIEGFEMLKGLAGVRTHQHREWIPIIENSQDYDALSRSVERSLGDHPLSHGFLLRRHGLYTWGRDLVEAKRHVEILEFLMEVSGRTNDGHRQDSR